MVDGKHLKKKIGSIHSEACEMRGMRGMAKRKSIKNHLQCVCVSELATHDKNAKAAAWKIKLIVSSQSMWNVISETAMILCWQKIFWKFMWFLFIFLQHHRNNYFSHSSRTHFSYFFPYFSFPLCNRQLCASFIIFILPLPHFLPIVQLCRSLSPKHSHTHKWVNF